MFVAWGPGWRVLAPSEVGHAAGSAACLQERASGVVGQLGVQSSELPV